MHDSLILHEHLREKLIAWGRSSGKMEESARACADEIDQEIINKMKTEQPKPKKSIMDITKGFCR